MTIWIGESGDEDVVSSISRVHGMYIAKIRETV